MKAKRSLSRWSLARRLQDLALRIGSGKPIRIGKRSVRLPDRIILEQELEPEDGQTELELEISWPAAKRASRQAPARRTARRSGNRRKP